MTAKPAGEPRWIPEDVRDLLNAASKHSRNLGEYWNKVTDALNAAETRAAQPGDARSEALEQAAQSCERRASQWATEPEPHATRASIDINAELRNEATTIRGLKAEPGDAPKLTADDWSSCAVYKPATCEIPDELLVPQTLDALNALLASRSTPAAPAPASTEAPGAPAAIMASDRNLAIDLLCMYDDTISTEELTKRLAGRISEIRRSAPAAPSTEALIAAGDALRDVLEEHYIKDGDGCDCGCGVWMKDYQEWLEHIMAAVAALHPASEAAKPGPAGKQGG